MELVAKNTLLLYVLKLVYGGFISSGQYTNLMDGSLNLYGQFLFVALICGSYLQ